MIEEDITELLDAIEYGLAHEARDSRVRIRNEFAMLRAERDLLREAVEAVEWVPNPDPDLGERYMFCPWCEGIVKYGHEPTCLRQRALGIESTKS